MKRFVLLVCLLFLTACSANPQLESEPALDDPSSGHSVNLEESTTEDVPSAETPVPEGDPERLYLYTNGGRYLAIDAYGRVVLETSVGQMSILRQDGKAVGIAITRSEGSVTNEWGWAQPEKTWCDIYDTAGRLKFSLPTSYVSLQGNYLTGYNEQLNTTQLYSASDGSLLYDDVCSCYALGEYYYLNQYDWASAGFVLDRDGREIFRLPDGYTDAGSILGDYIIVTRNDLYGVMTPQGTYLLPCEYLSVRSTDDTYLYAQTDSGWQVVDPQTGNVLFRYPTEIYVLLQDAAIVATDETSDFYQLIALDQTPLMELSFSWPSRYDFDGDGEPEFLEARINDYSNTILFRPDGTILHQTEENCYLTLLDSEYALASRYVYHEDDPSRSEQFWHLLDLKTGQMTPLRSKNNTYYSPLYSEHGAENGLLSMSGPNEQGWYRTGILDRQGNVLLKDLQDMIYRGDHIFQCALGFRSGLLKLDGTWLYEESSFSTLDDN